MVTMVTNLSFSEIKVIVHCVSVVFVLLKCLPVLNESNCTSSTQEQAAMELTLRAVTFHKLYDPVPHRVHTGFGDQGEFWYFGTYCKRVSIYLRLEISHDLVFTKDCNHDHIW